MDMKIRQIVEVSKLPNGKYVVCVISIAPRWMTYYHTQKEPHLSYRWMREDEWSAFDSAIESLAFEANYGDSIKKSVELTPLVHLKVQSVTLSRNQLCQMHTDIKDLIVKNIAMAVKCEIEYGEKSSSETKLEENENNEPVRPASPQTDRKPNLKKKERKPSIALKPDEDLDQQIQSFHIGQQDFGCLTPMTSSATINTTAPNSASKLYDMGEAKHNAENGNGTRQAKRSQSTSEEATEHASASAPARQRRTVSKPKRFQEFVMQPKRQSFSPKSEVSDSEFSEEICTPKRSRKVTTGCKTTAAKANHTPAAPKIKRETPQSCSRALFHKENDLKIEILGRNEHKKNMEQLMESLTSPSPPRVKFLSLNDMTVAQVMSTLSVIKPRLDALFEDVSNRDYIKGHGDISHFLVYGLISDKIKNEMMRKLGELYEKDETPKFGSHFINVLMPEWIICLFMKRYKMKREDAIEHLKAQNIQHIHLFD